MLSFLAVASLTVVLLLLIGNSADPEEEVVAWKFKEGQKFAYSRTQDRRITTHLTGQTTIQTLVRVTEMTLLVKAVEATGSARITLTIDRIQLNKTSPKEIVEYDSARPQQAEGASTVGKGLALLVGTSFSYHMTRQGKISEFELSQETSKRFDGHAAILTALGGKDGLQHLIPTVLLPESNSSIGHTWHDTADSMNPFSENGSWPSLTTTRAQDKRPASTWT